LVAAVAISDEKFLRPRGVSGGGRKEKTERRSRSFIEEGDVERGLGFRGDLEIRGLQAPPCGEGALARGGRRS
jgi:hypothetical protein